MQGLVNCMKERNHGNNIFVSVLIFVVLTGCGMIHIYESTSKYEHSEIADDQQVQMNNIEGNLNSNIQGKVEDRTLIVDEASDVAKLQIRNGSTGEELIIEDEGTINTILDSLKSLNVERHENGNVQGYIYSISIYNNTPTQKMYIRGDSIEVGGTIYYVGSTQDVIEYICSLENE